MRSRRSVLSITAAVLALSATAHASVTISTKKTRNMSCTNGICTPTGSNANLNVAKLVAMLSNSDVTVKSVSTAPTLGVLDALAWASAHRLTLDSFQSIHIRAPVTVEGTSGLTLITDDGGSGGDYDFYTATSGSITFWDTSSSLIINGQSFTLVKDIATLASDISADPSGLYALSADYDASVDGSYKAPPIAAAFTGALEGLGHAVSNLAIHTRLDQNAVALFSHIGQQGTVRDLGLVKVDISSNGRSIVGSLAAVSDGTLIAIYATGSVYGKARATVGGLVGQDTGTIVKSYATAGAGAGSDSQMGGLVGYVSSAGLIENSFATGYVTGSVRDNAGGLVASNQGTILNSFATGVADAGFTGDRTYYAGGLVAVNGGIIESSFATGFANVTCCGDYGGSGIVGGLAGENAGTISNSYATGGAGSDEDSIIGCLVGSNDGAISKSYSTGVVGYGRNSDAGGLLGDDSSENTQNSYWDLDTSQITDPSQGAGYPPNDPGITGLTDAQLKSGLPAGFDPTVWGENPNINNGYPYLLANPPQ